MKIAILGKWPDDLDGGVAVHTVNLIKNLSKLDKTEVYFISFANESKIIKMNNAKVILIKSPRAYHFIPFLPLLKLKFVIKKINPDIVQVQGTNISPYLIYSLFSFNNNKIMNVYGLKFNEVNFNENTSFSILNRIIAPFIEKYALSRFSNIIVESNYIKKIINKFTRSNVYVIPDGIELETMVEAEPKEEIDIFLASRLVELKGIDLLIEAVSILKKKYPEIKIYIAGMGPNFNKLKELTKRLKLENNIKFLGFISDDEKYSYYKSSKVVVVPSRWDCSPISIFEGIGAGKPVIASSNTNSEILENGVNGLIFKSEYVQDLANKLEILLEDNKLRKKMEEAALKKAYEYSWDKIAEKYQQVYGEVMKNG